VKKMQVHATGLWLTVGIVLAGVYLCALPADAQYENTQVQVIVDQLNEMAGAKPVAKEPAVPQQQPGAAPMAEPVTARAARPTFSKPVGEVKKLPSDWFIPYKTEELKLQVGDVVDISVFGQPDTVAIDVPVAPDGKIYYMFLDGIPAEGRTIGEVQKEIEQKLLKLFTSPVVTIIPKQFYSNSVNIFGKVAVPGHYPLERPMTIRQAVALAQGVSMGIRRGDTVEVASFKESWIMRDGEVLPVNFRALFRANDTSQDIYVRPGDTIFIASSIGAEVYLMGAVSRHRTMPFYEGMTLIDLISGVAAGDGAWGVNASLRRVAILRGDFPDPEVIIVNLKEILTGDAPDVFLTNGDIVYMPQKRFLFWTDLTKLAIRVVVRSTAREFGADFTDKYLFPDESGVNDDE